jgi:aryl-alcohol dehydrogenase-like predicted oxidoreductase
MTIPTRKLGLNGPEVSIVGLGAMGMSDLYGPADDTESLATLHAAMDAGVNLIDTADFYASGGNEMLIARALKERKREDVVLSVKFGSPRTPDGQFQPVPVDVSPSAVKDRLAFSLRRLNTDYIDIYRPSRLNPEVPLEETVGALEEMRQAGYIRHIGLSELNSDSIRRAAAVAPISDLQIEYSLLSRRPEDAIFPTLRELSIGVTGYSVLSRGLLSGHWHANRELTAHDFRNITPRFHGENLEINLRLVNALGEVGSRMGVTTAQLAIAWVVAQGETIVPLFGARTRERLAESLGAIAIHLDAETLAEIETAIPKGSVAGERYASYHMVDLDSEQSIQ